MNEKTYFSKVWSVEPLPEGDWSEDKKKHFFFSEKPLPEGDWSVDKKKSLFFSTAHFFSELISGSCSFL